MPEISHQTKITIGLAMTVASVIFSAGYFYAKQESMAVRLANLEAERDKIGSLSENVAVMAGDVKNLKDQLGQAITRWDKHIDAATSKN